MADLTLAFGASPVKTGEQIAFIEGALESGETTIELDLKGNVRLSAIAFEAAFAGATITVKAVVPWASGDLEQLINELTISIAAGEIVSVPYSDFFWPSKILLTVNTGQSTTKKIGFFGWLTE